MDVKEIIIFLEEITGATPIQADTDILEELGVYGDDFTEMLEAYAAKYQVDFSQYLWYFHNEEEGLNIGSLFFKPPYAIVKRIPVTPELLTKFAETKKWEIDYPQHQLPEKRYDVIINQIISILLLLVLTIVLFWKWLFSE